MLAGTTGDVEHRSKRLRARLWRISLYLGLVSDAADPAPVDFKTRMLLLLPIMIGVTVSGVIVDATGPRGVLGFLAQLMLTVIFSVIGSVAVAVLLARRQRSPDL